jgi:DNA repair exonuclease SbcCD nuclease subunit
LDNIHIIFFSDTHLGFDYPVRPRVNRRRRGEDFFENFQTVLSYAKSVNSDLIIHGGDLFFRSKILSPIVDRVYHLLSNFADSGIPVYIVPGNHERSRLPTSLFINHPLIYIFDKPKIYSILMHGTELNIGGFPFIRGDINSSFLSVLEFMSWRTYTTGIKILVMNKAIEGATVGLQNFTFRKGKDVISISLLPDDTDVVLCGHIHRQQVLKKQLDKRDGTLPVIFCGSTERTSFAEKNETKGFYHLTFSPDSQCKWQLTNYRFIELSSRPMIDITIQSGLEAQHFGHFLETKIRDIDQNSIIRFKSAKPLNGELLELLRTDNLAKFLPGSMNFSLSPRIFNQE